MIRQVAILLLLVLTPLSAANANDASLIGLAAERAQNSLEWRKAFFPQVVDALKATTSRSEAAYILGELSVKDKSLLTSFIEETPTSELLGLPNHALEALGPLPLERIESVFSKLPDVEKQRIAEFVEAQNARRNDISYQRWSGGGEASYVTPKLENYHKWRVGLSFLAAMGGAIAGGVVTPHLPYFIDSYVTESALPLIFNSHGIAHPFYVATMASIGSFLMTSTAARLVEAAGHTIRRLHHHHQFRVTLRKALRDLNTSVRMKIAAKANLDLGLQGLLAVYGQALCDQKILKPQERFEVIETFILMIKQGVFKKKVPVAAAFSVASNAATVIQASIIDSRLQEPAAQQKIRDIRDRFVAALFEPSMSEIRRASILASLIISPAEAERIRDRVAQANAVAAAPITQMAGAQTPKISLPMQIVAKPLKWIHARISKKEALRQKIELLTARKTTRLQDEEQAIAEESALIAREASLASQVVAFMREHFPSGHTAGQPIPGSMARAMRDLTETRRSLKQTHTRVVDLGNGIDSIGTEIHLLQLQQSRLSFELPSATELTKEAAAAEQGTANTSANADLARGLRVGEEVSATPEFQAIMTEFTRPAAEVAQPEPISEPPVVGAASVASCRKIVETAGPAAPPAKVMSRNALRQAASDGD